MNYLHFLWLELAILTPLVGAVLVSRVHDPEKARRGALAAQGLTLVWTVAAWIDFSTLHTFAASDHWDAVSALWVSDLWLIDELSAPLLTLAALQFFLTILSTLRTKMHGYPFGLTLVSESLMLAMLACGSATGIIVLLVAQCVPVWQEIRATGRSTRVFTLHSLLFIGLLVVGSLLYDDSDPESLRSLLAVGMLVGGVLVRSGVVPVHCWMTDLFEKATFGTALLYVAPMAGAYAAVRLVIPVAPDWALRGIALMSLVTAVYAAAMSLAQSEVRRFFCYLFLSHSSLVLVGVQVATPLGLTGGLYVWLSVGISLTGFGLTLRALESRTGRISLADYHGLYEHMPSLAVFFLLTGLASVGFPGTAGFVGTELLMDGAIDVYPYVGVLVVFAAALNGIAVLHAYLRLFTGTVHTASIPLSARLPERIAVLSLTALILGGGIFPQAGVTSRYHAATEILSRRRVAAPTSTETIDTVSGIRDDALADGTTARPFRR
ncbi:MAG: proton-conducting transporter membrane subunit [Planctomycetaceae bacterium]